MATITEQYDEETTITYRFDYQPEEKQTRNYPGCPELVQVYGFDVDGDTIGVLCELTEGISGVDNERLNDRVLNLIKSRRKEAANDC